MKKWKVVLQKSLLTLIKNLGRYFVIWSCRILQHFVGVPLLVSTCVRPLLTSYSIIKVYLTSPLIMNGVCVKWIGCIDLESLNGKAYLAFDEDRARVGTVSCYEPCLTVLSMSWVVA